MKRLESKIGILQHKVKNTNQLKIKNQNLRLEKMRLLNAVKRRDKKAKELQERIDEAIKYLQTNTIMIDENHCGARPSFNGNELYKILKGDDKE